MVTLVRPISLRNLAPEQEQAFRLRVRPIMSRWLPDDHAVPHERQRAFLLLPHREAFYGGAAGGGKSDALLMAALQYVDEPGYHALIVRRTYSDLSKPGAIMERCQTWLAPHVAMKQVRWDDVDKTFTFPSKAKLTFGHIQHEKNRFDYQGAEFQFIGFDELTQFSEKMYRYLFSRLRRLVTQAHIPIRMRSASNPGGIGHEWVKQRFIIEGRARHRPFIPARAKDNPYLDQREYKEGLSQLDPVTRMQLDEGNWDVIDAGPLFDKSWFRVVEKAPDELRPARFWDLAATKEIESAYTCGGLFGIHKGVNYLSDVRRLQGHPHEVDDLILRTAEQDGKGVEIIFEEEPGSGGKHTVAHMQRDVLKGYTVHAYRPRTDKVSRARPFASDAKAGLAVLVRGSEHGGRWIGPFLDEAHAFPNGHKDQIDICSMGLDWTTDHSRPNIRSFR